MMNVILIEDDPRVRDFLERGLRAEGYRVRSAQNGIDGFALARDFEREAIEDGARGVILLDIMLPLMTGLEVCQNLRASRSAMPILMLTALGATQDRVAGLRMGADDYLVKPFAFEELLARIEALGRRSPALTPAMGRALVVADLVLDRATLKVTRAGRDITLTARELALLELLMSAPGRVFSRERILANVWGLDEDPLTNVVDVFIRRLRAKIDIDGAVPLFETVRGIGYRMAAMQTPSATA